MVKEFRLALEAMFTEMNQSLSRQTFEWQNNPSMLVRPFLARFDYIFTLNQDLLLECHYLNDGSDRGKFHGVQIPGMKPLDSLPRISPIAVKDARWMPETGHFKIEPRLQPYIKLHGSSNWIREGEPPSLLVLGGGKEIEIAQDPLLRWYLQVFSEALRRPGAKLMVIGYSFGDEHINKAIEDAADLGGLTAFIVDPAGVDVLKNHKMRSDGVTYPQSIRDRLSPHIRGASRRALSSTFGNDRVEHHKVMSFLDS
jgi:SIR2-like domain